MVSSFYSLNRMAKSEHGAWRAARGIRCRIVNTSRILAVHPLLSGTYEMELSDGSRLTTGCQYKDAVQRLIRG